MEGIGLCGWGESFWTWPGPAGGGVRIQSPQIIRILRTGCLDSEFVGLVEQLLRHVETLRQFSRDISGNPSSEMQDVRDQASARAQ